MKEKFFFPFFQFGYNSPQGLEVFFFSKTKRSFKNPGTYSVFKLSFKNSQNLQIYTLNILLWQIGSSHLQLINCSRLSKSKCPQQLLFLQCSRIDFIRKINRTLECDCQYDTIQFNTQKFSKWTRLLYTLNIIIIYSTYQILQEDSFE